MFWNRKPKPTRPAPPWDEFGYGPFHIVFTEHSIPGDDWIALRATYDTEALPVTQLSGPTFFNRTQTQTIRGPGEVGVILQAQGLMDVQALGINTGTLYSSPLTDINSAPGGIPVVAQGNFVIDPQGL